MWVTILHTTTWLTRDTRMWKAILTRSINGSYRQWINFALWRKHWLTGNRLTRRKSKELNSIKRKHAISSVLKLTSRWLYRTLVNEWTNLIELKKQSLIRKIAVHEEDKGKIADIFERINGAREQLVVRICVIVFACSISLLILFHCPSHPFRWWPVSESTRLYLQFKGMSRCVIPLFPIPFQTHSLDRN